MLFGRNEEWNYSLLYHLFASNDNTKMKWSTKGKLLTTGQLDTKYFLANICLDLAREIERERERVKVQTINKK